MMLISSVRVMCAVLLGVASSLPQVGVGVLMPATPRPDGPAIEAGKGAASTAESVRRAWEEEQAWWAGQVMSQLCPALPGEGEAAEEMAPWWMREGGLAVSELRGDEQVDALPLWVASGAAALPEAAWPVPPPTRSEQSPGREEEEELAREEMKAGLEAEKQSAARDARRELSGGEEVDAAAEPLVCGMRRLPMWLGGTVLVAGVFLLLAMRALRRHDALEAMGFEG